MKQLLNWKGHSFIALPARIYMGLIFIIASIHKIADPGAFAMDVATYDIVPLFLVNIMAICLPWIELAAGVLIITGIKSRAAAWLMLGMMIMFITALLIALYNGLDMSCGCFASSSMSGDDAISSATVLRDTAWLLITLYILIFDVTPIGIPLLKSKIYKKRTA